MLNCRDITKLISLSLDKRLPWHQRLAVRIHLLYCKWCRRYARQVQFLRQAAKRYSRQLGETFEDKLPPDARAHIAEQLRRLPPRTPPDSL